MKIHKHGQTVIVLPKLQVRKKTQGSLQVGVELGADCEGAQGYRQVIVEDPGLAKVEPGDDARVAVVSESGVFVHFPQDGEDRGGLIDVAGRVR